MRTYAFGLLAAALPLSLGCGGAKPPTDTSAEPVLGIWVADPAATQKMDPGYRETGFFVSFNADGTGQFGVPRQERDHKWEKRGDSDRGTEFWLKNPKSEYYYVVHMKKIDDDHYLVAHDAYGGNCVVKRATELPKELPPPPVVARAPRPAKTPPPPAESKGRQRNDLGPASQNAYGVAFSPDGKRLAVGLSDRGRGKGVVRLFDVASGKVVGELQGHTDYIWAVAFSADGKRLASGSNDRTARVWDLDTNAEVARVDGFGERVTGVAFSPDAKLLLAGSNDFTAVLYDLTEKKVKFALEGHTGSVRGVAFAPDGKSCATCGKDKVVRVWNPETGQPVHSLKSPDVLYCVTYTPDSRRLIFAGGTEFGGDHTIKMAGLTPKPGKAATFKGHGDSVWAVSLTADAKTLVSCGYHDKTARVWDVATLTATEVLNLGTEVVSAAITPDGRWVATATTDRVVLWEMPPPK